MPQNKVVDRIKALTSPELATNMEHLTARLVSDRAFRSAFVKNPQATLKELGIPADKGLKFSDRDKQLLELIGDPEISALYRKGDVAGLRVRIRDFYPKLTLPDHTVAEDVAADFDVLIEAEAVAVAVVAVAAVAVGMAVLEPTERFRNVEEVTGVLNARIAALEARLRLVEGRIR